MLLTRDFNETIGARAAGDPAFRETLLKEAVEVMLAGDIAVGKAVLRNYINATVGFEILSAETKIRPRASCACSAMVATPALATCSV